MTKKPATLSNAGHPHGHSAPASATTHTGHPHGAMRTDGLSGNPHAGRSLPDGTPMLRLIAWEVTRSCNLACRHCRAEAHMEPYPGELSTQEAKTLIDSFTQTGNPIIIFTGGEPLLRKDIFELVAYAHEKGLRCVMAPNGTLITPENARRMKECGIQRCSISIDGATAEAHDLFRGVPGAFQKAMEGISYLKAEGIEFQINSTVTKTNLPHLKKYLHLLNP